MVLHLLLVFLLNGFLRVQLWGHCVSQCTRLPLEDVIEKCGISKMTYADDTQDHVSIPKCTSRAKIIARIESCLGKIQNSLKMKLGKTEVVHVRPRDKLPSSLSITVSDIPILSVSKARDLVVIVQDDLGMKTHINTMCKSAAMGTTQD